jgi:hypothetical protein
MASGTFSADATANDYNTALSLAQSQARSEAFTTLGQNISFDRASTSDKINPNNTYTVTFTTTATQVEVPAPVSTSGDAALGAINQEVADLRTAAESSTPLPVDPITESLLAEQELFRQFQAEEALNARLDRAAELDLANSGDAALEAAARAREAADLQTAALTYSPEPVSTLTALDPNEFSAPDQPDTNADNTRGLTNNAQGQSTNQTRVNQPAAADWRVKISLAQNSTYLYNAPSNRDGSGGPGILAPLLPTNGVIFPYTPSIETSYTATYAKTELTHSNYKGQFYQNSSVGDIIIRGTFTAQDTREASYLLAVNSLF